MAKQLLPLVFSNYELKSSTPSGQSGYVTFNQEKWEFLLKVVFEKFPIMNNEDMNTVRRNVKTSISTYLRKFRWAKKSKD